MKHVSEVVPAVLQNIIEPPPKRQDAPIDFLQRFFAFELRDGPQDWNGRPVRPQLIAMMQATYHFIEDVKERKPPRWLSLLGWPGAGKTYLARKVWNWYRRSDLFRAKMVNDEAVYPGQWCNWPEMAGELSGNEGYGTLEDLQTETLVVLDEIGADRDRHGHVRDCLGRLCSLRVNKWTVITSNLSLGDVQRHLDTRIASRMMRDGSVVVDVEVPDFALRRAVCK